MNNACDRDGTGDAVFEAAVGEHFARLYGMDPEQLLVVEPILERGREFYWEMLQDLRKAVQNGMRERRGASAEAAARECMMEVVEMYVGEAQARLGMRELWEEMSAGAANDNEMSTEGEWRAGTEELLYGMCITHAEVMCRMLLDEVAQRSDARIARLRVVRGGESAGALDGDVVK